MLQMHILDPWWNPASEDQAMDRVHRIGQQRSVDVWRYACNDSIEERILVLQARLLPNLLCTWYC
jgi:SWI/SNF-related matrix-associated actin-dependent regulator of chromatin subfamily A3